MNKMATERKPENLSLKGNYPVSILYKSIAGRYRSVSYPDGPITARYRFIKNANWVLLHPWANFNQTLDTA